MVTATRLKPYRELVPLADGTNKLRLNLHRGQQRVWRSTARFPVILSGTQWGKTSFEPHWLYREIVTQGEGDYLVGSATFPLLGLKVLPEFQTVFCDIHHWGDYRDDRMGNRVIQSNHDKSRIIFFSATNPEAIESATAKAAVLDEAGQKQFRQGTWEAVQRRLSINRGRCLFGTTLYSLGWLKTEVYDRAMAGDKDFEIIHGDSIDNPMFPPEEYYRQQRLLPAWKFDMFYRGRYSRPVGLIYDCFDTGTMITSPSAMPVGWEKWAHYSGHDFGTANPAALFVCRDPVSRLVYVHTDYLPGQGRAISQHVTEFWRIMQGKQMVRRLGGSHQEEEVRQGYGAHGWHIQEPEILGVDAGIQNVYGIIKSGLMRVSPDCKHLIDEITSYSHTLDERYQPTDEIEDKENYHLMDCLRYVCSAFRPETVNRGGTVVKRASWRL